MSPFGQIAPLPVNPHLWTRCGFSYALAHYASRAGRPCVYAPLRITSPGARDWPGCTPSHRPTPFEPPPTPMIVAILITQPREIRDARQARQVIAILARTASRNRLAIPIVLRRPVCPVRFEPLFLPGGGSFRSGPFGAHDISRTVSTIVLAHSSSKDLDCQHDHCFRHARLRQEA